MHSFLSLFRGKAGFFLIGRRGVCGAVRLHFVVFIVLDQWRAIVEPRGNCVQTDCGRVGQNLP